MYTVNDMRLVCGAVRCGALVCELNIFVHISQLAHTTWYYFSYLKCHTHPTIYKTDCSDVFVILLLLLFPCLCVSQWMRHLPFFTPYAFSSFIVIQKQRQQHQQYCCMYWSCTPYDSARKMDSVYKMRQQWNATSNKRYDYLPGAEQRLGIERGSMVECMRTCVCVCVYEWKIGWVFFEMLWESGLVYATTIHLIHTHVRCRFQQFVCWTNWA